MTEIYISIKLYWCYCSRETNYSIGKITNNNLIGHLNKMPFYGECHTKVIVL